MYDTAMQFVVYGSPLMYAYLKLRCIRRVAVTPNHSCEVQDQ